MIRETRAYIIDADPFSRRWSSLLLARDWRSRVLGDAATLKEAWSFLTNPTNLINLVIVDARLFEANRAAGHSLEELGRLPGKPRVLLLSHRPVLSIFNQLPFPGFSGYLLKEEISDSLAWAADYADGNRWAVTPGILALLEEHHLYPHLIVLDGHVSFPGLTPNQLAFARQAVLYSMERGDLSDENNLDDDWTYTKISEIYEILGVNDLLSGEEKPETLFGETLPQLPRFQMILRKALEQNQKKTKESLAFHILTRPNTQEIHGSSFR